MNGPCFINVRPGSGHSFITSLILHSLSKDNTAIEFPEIGHSHDYVNKFKQVWVPPESSKKIYTIVVNKECTLDFKSFIEPNELLNTYPNSNLIVISETNSEKLRLEFNHFYKADPQLHYWNFYLEESKTNNKLRPNLNSFAEFTTEEVKELLTMLVTKQRRWDEKSITQYWTIFKNLYSDRVHILEYHNLINSLEVTLSLVEKVTEIPRTDALIKSYNNYAKRQQEFITKYMPWLSENI
jgi:hypothetical protein